MDIRVLKYFITVVKEQTILKASQKLHITQPTLSRQLMELEDELGCKLFIRSNRKITLTSEGIFLYNRAKEIITLVDKTTAQFNAPKEIVSGDIHIGCAETKAMRVVAKTIKNMQKSYPLIKYHFYSGNSLDIADKLDKGVFDFGVFCEPVDKNKYRYFKLPHTDHWGVLMRKDSPLASLDKISPSDLQNVPLILSQQDFDVNPVSIYLKKDAHDLNVIATYNLIYNAAIMAQEGLGYVICYDNLINTTGDSPLCMKQLYPTLEANSYIAWKKNHIFSTQAKLFIEQLQHDLL